MYLSFVYALKFAAAISSRLSFTEYCIYHERESDAATEGDEHQVQEVPRLRSGFPAARIPIVPSESEQRVEARSEKERPNYRLRPDALEEQPCAEGSEDRHTEETYQLLDQLDNALRPDIGWNKHDSQ